VAFILLLGNVKATGHGVSQTDDHSHSRNRHYPLDQVH